MSSRRQSSRPPAALHATGAPARVAQAASAPNGVPPGSASKTASGSPPGAPFDTSPERTTGSAVAADMPAAPMAAFSAPLLPWFGAGRDSANYGELIVQLTPQGVASLTASIPHGPLGSRTLGIPMTFGLAEVDEVLAACAVKSISRLHPPRPLQAGALGEHPGLQGTYRVRLGDDADAERIRGELAQVQAVSAVEFSRWREATVLPRGLRLTGQWGLTCIGCPQAWQLTRGEPSVVVAVVDSGVDLDHPELAPLLLPGQDFVDLAGVEAPPGLHFEGDWLQRDDQPRDEVGHGTHVAGTIACAGRPPAGVAGVNASCSLLPIKVLTRVVENEAPHQVRAIGSSADIAAGIRWAVDHGARVINLSFGSPSDTFVEREAIAYAISRGVLVVAAVGNEGSSEPMYPAAFPDVLAVGAIDVEGWRAPFSSTGPHLGLMAPGVDITSTEWSSTYGTRSGTSMASPHVTGVAALMLACNPALDGAQLRDLLLQTAVPLQDELNDPVPNDRYGHGLVNAEAAVSSAYAHVLVQPPPAWRPPMPTFPTRITFPPRPFPTLTRPTLTAPTRPTLPTFPTRPTFPTLTRPTFTPPTRPTLPTFPTRPTNPTFPTRPTNPTFPTLTRPTLTRPTRPTFPTNPTNPTNPTLTRPTLTRPTLTLTRPTLTRPTLTRPTLTLTRPTLTRPTITRPPFTRPIIRPPSPFDYGGGYGPGADPYGYEGYGYGDSSGYEADPYGGYGSGYDAYGGYGSGYADYGAESAYDPYGSGYDESGYADPYGAGYEGYYGGDESYDPYGTYGAGYDESGYADPYGYGQGYEGYDDYYGG